MSHDLGLGDPYNLKTVDVAAHLAESEMSVRRLVNEGKLRARHGSKGYRFRASDVNAYVKSTLVQPNAAMVAIRDYDLHNDLPAHRLGRA